MVEMKTFRDRDDWLNMRGRRIGGSDAAAVIGKNPWTTNVDLWRVKTWKTPQKDISDNAAVKFGTQAEAPIRKLFALDHPEYKVEYKENNMWLNSEIPHAHYSADGWLTDKQGRKGLLEIKTATITSSAQKAKWQPKEMPAWYYIQLIHGLMVTGFDFVYLRGYLRYDFEDELWVHIKEYKFDRKDVEEDIKELKAAEERFWRYVMEDKEPPLILPGI